MRADSLDLPHTLRVLFTNWMDQVRPVRLPMSLYNLSDSTEGKLRALQIRSRILQARPWSLLPRSWDAGLESTLCAFIYAKRSWNELFRVVTKVLSRRFFLIYVGPSFLIWSHILWCYFFFSFSLNPQIFSNYLLWTKHRGYSCETI